MLQPSPPLITRHDYEAMREGPPYYQVIEGDLLMSPSPTTYHQELIGRIFSAIDRFLEKRRLGRVFLAPLDVFLTETNVFQPDVMFVSKDHSSIITAKGIEGAPDLVIEILSPSTAVYDKRSKRKIYARTGVQEFWLVDPEIKQIQIFHLAEDSETPVATHGPKAVFSSRLLPGLKFKASSIFRNPSTTWN